LATRLASPVPLPGGLSSAISGIGIFYPDKTPTQRVGIVADVEVHPTIAGIRAGRDEVLEEALRQILDTLPSTPAVVLPTTTARGFDRKAIAVYSAWLSELSSTRITTLPA
jgi:hypothetical protein